MRRSTLPLLLCSLFILGACTNSSTLFSPPLDGDLIDHSEVDKDTEAEAEGEHEFDVDDPCTPGGNICLDAQHSIQCNDQRRWEVKEVCSTGQTCQAGRCEPPLTDGDPEPEAVKCQLDKDCWYGAGCEPGNAAADSEGCVKKINCQNDSNCEVGYKCLEQANWKECIKTPDKCQTNEDCVAASTAGFGFVCQKGDKGYNECVDTNQCKVDTDCTVLDQVCKKGPLRYVCQPTGKECAQHSDCDYDYKCDTTWPVPVCVYASNCKVEKDCAALEACVGQANWRSCQINASLCKTDTDCKEGSTCVVLVAGQGYCKGTSCKDDTECPADRYCATVPVVGGSCKSRNECTLDSDCETGKICKNNGTYLTCQDPPTCSADSECQVGYKCLGTAPKKTCQYANTCKSDSDCNKFSRCLQTGNIYACKTFGDFKPCTNDTSCAANEYCESVLLGGGVCRGKGQCHVNVDCGKNMTCKTSGEGEAAYNTCVASNPQSCLLDFQCSNDWLCIKNKCTPHYAGQCEAVEGVWSVLISTGNLCMGITPGNQFEFLPREGCTGDVKLTGSANLSFGTFAKQAETSNVFDIKLLAVLNCTADVPVAATVMQVNCGTNCSINLIKGFGSK